MIKLLALVLCLGIQAHPEEKTVNDLVNNWHQNAAKADFNAYFGFMHEESVFIGTAPGERWTKKQFMDFSKPYFDKGKAWDFKSKERHWVFSDDGNIAWFDEVLTTWMEDCRGSGVLKKINGEWKLMFYDLHVIIENEKIKQFIKLRKK